MLNEIIISTQERIKDLKNCFNYMYFEKSKYFNTNTISLSNYIKRNDKNGIIAEFKRCSPLKGELNLYCKVDEVTVNYMRAGCSALSIITEPIYFKGSNADLTLARKFNYCPILRKDFIIDEIQIFESKSIGADAILLIARILTKAKIKSLFSLATSLGLEVLIEVNNEIDLDKIPNNAELIGINYRDLSTMKIYNENSIPLEKTISGNKTIIAESGINAPNKIKELKKKGFDGFLIGSAFMQNDDPGVACIQFCKQIHEIKTKYAN